MAAGQLVGRKNRDYIKIDQAIRTLVGRYANGDIPRFEFLTGVSHNFSQPKRAAALM